MKPNYIVVKNHVFKNNNGTDRYIFQIYKQDETIFIAWNNNIMFTREQEAQEKIQELLSIEGEQDAKF
jgi:hypothetical protein